jgi:uncharacterized repeat protein (TIGR03803 family)
MANARQDGLPFPVTQHDQAIGLSTLAARGRGRAALSEERTGRLWFACALAAIAIAPLQAQTATETVLHNFASPPKGANPYAGVIRDSAGNLYGTTTSGGSAGAGVVYKLDAAGRETVLYSFAGGTDGRYPTAGVISDSAGNLYGTTVNGGTGDACVGGCGVVFKLDTAGQETVLHTFTGGADGGEPYAGVIQDPEGNLYGTTSGGGAADVGVVFEVDTAGQQTVLYNFCSLPSCADGAAPMAGLIRDSAGNLYGTASGLYGVFGAGVVFKVNTAGDETVLYSFTGGADGGSPYASGVVRDSAGNLYGTTEEGGTEGAGVVFKVNTAGQETVLYNFCSLANCADGAAPYAGVILDSAGDLYGTTGSPLTGYAGVVFKVNTAGQETVLYAFAWGADGDRPFAGLIRDSAGNLYGTTSSGGAAEAGVVFKVDTAGQETVLYSFPGATDGAMPWAGVIRDSAGNLYGTTSQGGTAGAGTVFKIDAAGHETILYTFTGGADGIYPYAGVIEDSAGNLYGTTAGGGAAGVVYEVDTAGQETVLYSFTGGADGGAPYGGVIRDSTGNLYGTTYLGGTANAGVVFKVDTSGTETVLYSFTGGADGDYPEAGVIRDSAGNLYGTTIGGGAAGYGVVYEVDTAGQETVLYSFTGGADGGFPYSGVIRDSAGNLYGTTNSGGAAGYYGVVYEVDTAGQETVLYSFTGGAGGGGPRGVIRDSTGNLYGTTYGGGAAGYGVVYELNTSGQETVLYSFTGGAYGGYPYAGVIRDSAGNLYGTAESGGKESSGVVFKITGAPQVVTFTTSAPASAAYRASFTVAASASSGLPVTYSSAGACTNSGATYTMTGGTGECSVTATQAGTPPYAPAKATESTAATPATTTITVNYSPNPSAYGESVTFVANVTSSAGAPPNGETVSFESGATVLGTVKLNGGKAEWKTSTLPQGTDSVSAVYGGDVNLAPSSVTVTQTVDPPAPTVTAGCNIANSQSGLPPYPGSCGITNQGPDEAYNVRVTSVKINGASCQWKAPIKNLTPGQSESFKITCSDVITTCNISNTLTINGTFVGGTFSGTNTFVWCSGPQPTQE